MGDPPRADIRVGYACNNNCKFCCVSDQRKINLTTEQIKKDMDLGRKNGAEKVVFTGGEPTLRKDIVELVSYAKKMGYIHILIISNGRMISYKPFLDKLVAVGLNSLCFSLPDIDEEIYDDLIQVKGSYKQLMEAIENLKTHDLLISTITVITKKNYKRLPKITEYLSELSKEIPKFFSEFVFINPTDNAWRYREELVPKLSDVALYVHESLDLAKEKGLVLNVEAIPLCYMQGYENNVVELHMAKNRVFFDPEKSDYEYNESRRAEGKVKSEYCKDCRYDSMCEGVWKNYVDVYGDEELRLKENKGSHLMRLGYACNQKCIFCTVDKYDDNNIKKHITQPTLEGMSTEEANKEILIKKPEELTFTGGEPTLRKDLFDVIKFAKKNGVRNVVVNTNGTRLSEKGYINSLKEAGADLLLVSLHGHNKEISEKISQIKGSFDKTIKGIRKALEAEIRVSLVHVIYSGNYKYIEEFCKYVNDSLKDIEQINFVYVKPNDKDISKCEHLIPTYEKIEPPLKKGMNYCINKGIRFNVADVPLCHMGGYEKYNIQSQEIIRKYGNKHGSFDKWMKDRLANDEFEEYGHWWEKCEDCEMKNICGGFEK